MSDLFDIRYLLLKLFGIAVLLTGNLAFGLAGPTRQTNFRELIEEYDRGNFGAVDSVAPLSLDTSSAQQYATALTSWLGKEPNSRRIVVGATVAVELAHCARDRPFGVPAGFLTYASRLIRRLDHGPATEMEKRWHLAELAAMGAVSDPWVLTTGQLTSNYPTDQFAGELGRGGQVGLSATRISPDSRLEFLGAAAEEFAAFRPAGDAGGLLNPDYLTFALEVAKREPLTIAESASQATAAELGRSSRLILAAVGKAPGLVARFKRVRLSDDNRFDVYLHTGVLQATLGNYDDALANLASAAQADETGTRYLGFLVTGMVHYLLGHSERALEAFRLAVTTNPEARSGREWLAALTEISGPPGSASRGYEILLPALGRAFVDDPLALYWRGEALHWERDIVALRSAIRP